MRECERMFDQDSDDSDIKGFELEIFTKTFPGSMLKILGRWLRSSLEIRSLRELN